LGLRLFDVMEQGMLTLDKYGFHREIESPTTVLGTINPEGISMVTHLIDKKMIDVLVDLAKKIKRKFQEGIETGQYQKQDKIYDPNSR